MRYTIFLFGSFLLVPASILLASLSRRVRELVFGLLVFGTAFTDRYDINFVERWWYAGSTRGIEISFIDLLALVLLFSTLVMMRREGARLFWPASLGLMLVYFGYGCLSVGTSYPKIFGFFELTKLLRGLLVFLAVAFHVRTKRDAFILIFALGAVFTYEGGLAVWQRYTGAMFRVRGTFPHENTLGDYCVLGGPVLLAMSLSAVVRPPIRIFCAVAWTSAAVAVILTISRMPSVAFLATSAAVLVTAYEFQLDMRRIALVLALGVLMCGLFYRGLDKLEERHQAASPDGVVEGLRADHYSMGSRMASDHPFGVGLNNWAWYYHDYDLASGTSPYESTTEPGHGHHATVGHTLYGVTLGELGWPGLLILAALIWRWLSLSASLFLVKNRDLWSRIGVGCFFGFAGVFLGNGTEITFRNQQIFIIFNVLLGLMVAARRLRRMDGNQRATVPAR